MTHGFKGLKLHNTLTRAKEDFVPIDGENLRMYVCGPTVYDFAHIGNARPVIVFDVLFRLLRHLYGEDHVTYVRNITDVDDKINARALRDFPDLPLNEAIREVTETTARQFHEDVAALGCLPPTVEPRATEFVLPRDDGKTDMVSLIQNLIGRGHAYERNREILFDTASMPDYGRLSRRNLDEQQAGARVAVDANKKNPADFVLWKQSSDDEPGWDATFTVAGRDLAIRGRPGWHIECSAMSAAYLGEVFDIHGGGLDLIFPHHENEIAQSRCAHGTPVMANTWLHNGFLQVEGRKMSKSEGNFVTIHDLLHTETFGGRKWPGEVLRLAMLMTHYREPIDFSVRRLEEAARVRRDWLKIAKNWIPDDIPNATVAHVLSDDLDFNSARVAIDALASKAKTTGGDILDKRKAGIALASTLKWLGVARDEDFEGAHRRRAEIHEVVERALDGVGVLEHFASEHVLAEDLEFVRSNLGGEELNREIRSRLALLREKNFAEADKIRDELSAQGIQLKDGKDPETGERVTTWEVKR